MEKEMEIKHDKSKENKHFSDTEPLKTAYPDVEQRKKVCASRLEKTKDYIYVRLEPHNLSSLQLKVYATYLVPASYKLSYLIAKLFPRLKLSREEGLFFFIKKKLVNLNTSFQ